VNLFFEIAAKSHGLRASELCDLQWSQVELTTGRLHVRRAKNGSPSVHPMQGDESFPQPGGNVTGFVTMEPTMAGKWLELLKEIAPRVARVAMLFNPATATYAEYWLKPFQAAAASFVVEAIAAPVHERSELDSVIAAQAGEPNSGLIVMPDTFTDAHRVEITSLAARYRLPAVYPYRQFTAVGGLLSYGDDLIDNFRRAPTYVDRILKGAKPNELPVQAPVKFELVINLKTAKAIGLDIPATILGHADEVIE
jgi:putative tryptophan/tyrosine transport system substrate-binding protein